MKKIKKLLTPITLISLIALIFPINQVSASLSGSIFQTTDTDFNGGTTSQTTVTNNSVALSQSFICGTSTVSYNGDTYATVGIGTQCWLAENLQTTLKPDGSGLTSYCNPSGCASPWGRLYDWNVTMNGATTATGCGAKIRGICPPGWHIPSDYTGCANDDFYLLSSYLGGDSVSGGKMKATGTTYWTTPNTGATNSSGFTAVGAGRWSSGSFYGRGSYGYFWTSFQYDASDAWLRGLFYNDAALYRTNYSKTYGYSVRCVKDDLNTIYYSSGTFTSGIIQRAQVASWGNIAWTKTGTGTITMKARTCTNSDCSDANRDWTANCTAITSGNAISTGNCADNSQKYVQYQATLGGDTVTTPSLDDVTLDYLYNPDTSLIYGIVNFFGSITFK